MNTLFFYAAIVVLALVVLAKIPGLEHFVRPTVQLLFDGLKFVVEHFTSWVVWLFKTVFRSHVWVLRNLVQSAKDLDPTHEVREDH